MKSQTVTCPKCGEDVRGYIIAGKKQTGGYHKHWVDNDWQTP